jgi:glyoxylase-like metal-dependent hydrolase (beta-lactamase superfamily II)
MKLTFLGTRGEIEARTALHRMHSCLMVGEQVLVDCGADWLGRLKKLRPQAIILTHAHLDHAGGLKRGAPCPVYATAQTWSGLKRYPVRDRETIEPRRPVRIGDIEFEAFSILFLCSRMPVARQLGSPSKRSKVPNANYRGLFPPLRA